MSQNDGQSRQQRLTESVHNVAGATASAFFRRFFTETRPKTRSDESRYLTAHFPDRNRTDHLPPSAKTPNMRGSPAHRSLTAPTRYPNAHAIETDDRSTLTTNKYPPRTRDNKHTVSRPGIAPRAFSYADVGPQIPPCMYRISRNYGHRIFRLVSCPLQIRKVSSINYF